MNEAQKKIISNNFKKLWENPTWRKKLLAKRAVNNFEKFKIKIKIDKLTRCWNWIGNKGRYGGIKVKGKQKLAHRYSWEIYNGLIPKGKLIMHKCDNTLCVNPKHLRIGTQKENIHDCIQKNRFIKGEKCHASKLTETKVKKIRELYRQKTQIELAKIFNVSQ